MTVIKIEVPMPPQTKPATQFGMINGHVRTWNKSTPQKIWLQTYLKSVISKMPDKITNPKMPLQVMLYYYLQIPKVGSQAKRNLMEWGVQHHISKPDLDNLTKFHLDAANGILWPDDRQIVNLSLNKRYSCNPRVTYLIMPIEENIGERFEAIARFFNIDEVLKIVSAINGRAAFLFEPESICFSTYTSMEDAIMSNKPIPQEIEQEFGSKFKRLRKILSGLKQEKMF